MKASWRALAASSTAVGGLYASFYWLFIAATDYLVSLLSTHSRWLHDYAAGGEMHICLSGAFTLGAVRHLQRRALRLKDVGERSLAELRQTADRLALAKEAAGIGTWSWEMRSDTHTLSETCCRIWNLNPQLELISHDTWLSRVHPEDRDRVVSAFNNALRVGSCQTEYRIMPRDGALVWISDHTRIYFDIAGTPIRAIAVHQEISDRKIREETIGRDRERLMLAIEAGKLGTWDWDLGNGRLFWSPRCYELFGVAGDQDLHYEDFCAGVHPDDRERVDEAIRDCLAGNSGFNIEMRIIRPDGTVRWLASKGQTHYDQQGRALRISGVISDITQRKAAEMAVRQSEMRYRNIIETAQEGILLTDARRVITLVNRRTTEMLGYSTEEMLGHDLMEIVPAEWRVQLAEDLERGRECPRRLEYWTRRKDGTPIYLTVSGSPIFDENGEFAGLLDMLSDNTERKRAEEALRQSQERFQLAACATRDIIWDWDIVRDCVWYSDHFWEIFGYDAATFPRTAQGWADLLHPDDCWVVSRQHDTFTSNEYRVRRVDGSWVHVLDRAYLIFDANGKPIRKIGVFSDISQSKETEQALRTSEARYRALFERNLAGVFRSTSDGKLLECNEAAYRMLGYDALEEMRQVNICNVCSNPDDGQRIIARLAEQKQLLNQQIELRRKDGKVVTVVANLNAFPECNGHPMSIEGTMIDITEVRKLQERLAQSQKMEAIGQLAGGVAHDFNNLLMVITSYSELALGKIADPKLKQHVQRILDACGRASQLTGQLLAFSRQRVVEPQLLNLSTVVREMEPMLSRLVREDIRIETSLDEKMSLCRADPTQLQQVLMNLIVNARDAMPDGGEIVIETGNVQVDSVFRDDRIAVAPGPYVRLGVRDTGTGMDPHTKERIFEPFFTTKELGRGTGLGLSTVYGIVTQNAGHISVESVLGQGTCFNILLPAVEGALASAVDEVLSCPSKLQCASILLVEDEDWLREAGAEFLRGRGYTVIPAANAEEALLAAKRVPVSIDAVVTDVFMPGLNGVELAEHIRKQHANARILLMSGYADTKLHRDQSSECPTIYLQKPFSFELLADKIAEVLG